MPGDVLRLAAGDMIPADLRLLAAKDLFVNQSAMTGESLPVEKSAEPQPRRDRRRRWQPATCASWARTWSAARPPRWSSAPAATPTSARWPSTRRTSRPRPTAFQTGINRVSWLLIRFMLVMVPIVFLINGFTKGDWLQALLFALSIAVGLTPEMLPMIVTSTLARGAVTLSRKKVIVKRLDAIQNFGAMDLLCTDKTGTLTQDRVVLKRHLDADGAESPEVLEYAWLNSHYQTGLRNLLDLAVLRTRRAAPEARRGRELPQDRRAAVRLRAPPHVGGGERARRPPPADLQGRGRGGAGGLHAGCGAAAARKR